MKSLHVIFKVGGAEYALPASDVLQMESYTGVTAVPGAAPHVLGIVQVRGKVVPVISLRLRFGLPAGEPGPDARLVVGSQGDRQVALLCDSAREVLGLEPEQLEAPPRAVTDDARGLVAAVARVGTRLIMLVDFAKVIGEDHGPAQ
jgi:purine-binding chemotaxis protein CheW